MIIVLFCLIFCWVPSNVLTPNYQFILFCCKYICFNCFDICRTIRIECNILCHVMVHISTINPFSCRVCLHNIQNSLDPLCLLSPHTSLLLPIRRTFYKILFPVCIWTFLFLALPPSHSCLQLLVRRFLLYFHLYYKRFIVIICQGWYGEWGGGWWQA